MPKYLEKTLMCDMLCQNEEYIRSSTNWYVYDQGENKNIKYGDNVGDMLCDIGLICTEPVSIFYTKLYNLCL